LRECTLIAAHTSKQADSVRVLSSGYIAARESFDVLITE